MTKILLILLSLPIIGFAQNEPASFRGCSAEENSALINYLVSLDKKELQKIIKAKKEGGKISKKGRVIVDELKALDPSTFFDLYKNIDYQISYLRNLTPSECTQNAINNYIAKNFNYPPIAKYNHIEEKIYVGFIINEKGAITEIKILKGEDKSLKEEALRLISSMPKFNPSLENGKPIPTSYTIPIIFKMQ